MERIVNEEKRKKFIENAGKRVNNVLHDIQILEPMARSNTYDFTRTDVEDMFRAMQETLNDAKEEFNRKFDEKARAEKKTFTFGQTPVADVNSVYSNVDANTNGTETVNTYTNNASSYNTVADVTNTYTTNTDTTSTYNNVATTPEVTADNIETVDTEVVNDIIDVDTTTDVAD